MQMPEEVAASILGLPAHGRHTKYRGSAIPLMLYFTVLANQADIILGLASTESAARQRHQS
jgi:hypothetical protein